MDFEWAENTPRDVEVGDRIELVSMPDDPDPIPTGTKGTVKSVTKGADVIGVEWDNGRTLNLIINVDEYRVLNESVDSKEINKSMPKPTLTGSKKTDLGKKVSKSLSKGFKSGKVKDIKVEQDEIVGGLADTLSPDDLAEKHGVSIDDIQKEIELGIEIELEHTDDPLIAKEIAMDHISEFSDYYSNERYGLVSSEKGLEKELDEITSAGGGGGLAGASGYSYSGPLSKKKNESRIFNVSELMKEVTATHNSGDYDNVSETPFDSNKDGWFWNDTAWYEDGKIVDDIAQLDHNWKDELISITKEDLIKSVNLLENQEDITEEDLDETTTFGSVFGDGFPVTPTFAAKKGQHIPSKKPIWKGGQIVQKIKNSGVLSEINKIKYNKDGDFVKFDPKCVKYKNQPWCSQGAIDNPIKLSKTTSDNITEVAKKLGVSEKEVEKMVINKLSR
jgi:hypothetical protein